MRRTLTAAIVFAALAVAAAGAAPAGGSATAAVDLPGECPSVMTTDELTRGMTGTALSVVEGRDPSSFDVEVLDVLRDGIAPGRDLVIVNLSGPVIDATGGLWFGASGSPVYVPDPVTGEQELVGALAYGLSFGSSSLAGVTPAEDMVDLLDPSLAVAERAAPRAVRVPRATVARMAASVGADPGELGNTLVRLKTPLSVSGMTERGMRRVRIALNRQSLPFMPYMGSSASAAEGEEPASLEAGDSFAAALSLGDVTIGGIGTTTVVCYGQAVAFGHPFDWTGDTLMAARAADTITIVKDPIFGSYKLASIAENAGTVTVDRLAGIAAELGDGPETMPVSSTATDVDRGRTRTGSSDAVLPDVMPFLVFVQNLVNIDVTIDRIGGGNAEMSYTISGVDPAGEPWSLARSNHFASQGDISFESVLELARNVELLHVFEDEGYRITNVDTSATDVEKAVEVYRLRGVRVWNGSDYVAVESVAARPGQTVLLRAILKPLHATGFRTVDLSLKVPTWAKRSGYIEVTGGSMVIPSVPCFFDDEECGEESERPTFETVRRELARQPRGDALLARLHLGPGGRVRASDTESLDAVVRGARLLGFELIGGRSSFEGRGR